MSSSLPMTGAIRWGVVACATWVALLTAGAVEAQPEQLPSTLLPMEARWTAALPGAVAAAPVHESGLVFIALRDGHVSAVNETDGTVVWQVIHQVVGQPTVGGNLLYVATRDELKALDTATGQTRWSIPIEAPLSAPPVWNAGWLIAALETQTLLALRAETGETIWRQSMGGRVPVAPSLAGDRMYVSLDNESVVALSLMTGKTLWEQSLGGTPSEILPLDDLFVGATDNYFYRLSRLDGSVKWRWRTGGDIVGLPAVDTKRVYFSSLDNVLWALNRSNGVQQWRQPLSARPSAGPMQAGDLLLLASISQDLSFFDPVTGVSYGRITAPSELAFPPLILSSQVDEPLLITVTGDGRLQALGRATGPVSLELATRGVLDGTAVGFGANTTPTSVNTTAHGPAAGEAADALAERPLVDGEYAIQVMAAANNANATMLVNRLVERGYPAYVLEPRQDDEPPLYRVRIGDYVDQPAAEAIGRQVEDEEALAWFVVPLP